MAFNPHENPIQVGTLNRILQGVKLKLEKLAHGDSASSGGAGI